jgi:ribosomal small subunit protein bTHX
MGKGDKKTKRGKIIIGSTGVRRPRKKKRYKPVIVQKAEPKAKEIPEVKPVELVPEIAPVTEQVEEKAPKKAAVKKAAPKKQAEKAEEDAPKPKAAKTKKKVTKPAEDLFTEKKEGTE